MSKIFEALQNTGGALQEAVMSIDLAPVETAVVNATDPYRRSDPPPEQALIDSELVMPTVADRSPHAIRMIAVRVASKNPLLPFEASATRPAEQYRIIRTKISQHPVKPHMIVVTSAHPGDGKTITSINLAAAMSLKAGVRVLLVDGDLRRSTIAKLLGLPAQPGLTDLLSGHCDLDSALIRIEQFPNLYVLTAGTSVPNPTELLDAPRWAALCSRIRTDFDHAIVDSPPVAAVSDYDLIQAAVDGVIVVARPDHTRRTTFKNALAMVTATKLVGIVLNDVREWFLWNVHSGPAYHYHESV